TIAARVTDNSGHVAIGTAPLTVLDVAPTAGITGPSSAFTGTYSLALSYQDPGPDPAQHWTINWGDGSALQTILGNPSTVSHAYPNPSGSLPYVISATATNQYGTYSAYVNGSPSGGTQLPLGVCPAPVLGSDGTFT